MSHNIVIRCQYRRERGILNHRFGQHVMLRRCGLVHKVEFVISQKRHPIYYEAFKRLLIPDHNKVDAYMTVSDYSYEYITNTPTLTTTGYNVKIFHKELIKIHGYDAI